MTDKLPPKILVLEEDEISRGTLCNAIERHWFDVLRASNLELALRLIAVNRPNIIIVGTKTLSKDPIESVRKMRAVELMHNVPVVFLVSEEDETNRYIQADGFVSVIKRPFTPNDVINAIKDLLRDCDPILQDKVLHYKNMTMDLATYQVKRAGVLVHLGPTEFKILQLLMQFPRTIFSREQIVDYVWGTDANESVEARTVDVHVNRLRSVLKKAGDTDSIIKTVRSSGYCLNLPGEVESHF